MKTKDIVKNEDFKRKIIIKTRDIVSRFGYKKSTTEEIAKALNRTKGALYHYFENREDLIKAVINYEGTQLRAAVNSAMSAESDLKNKLTTFFLTRAGRVYELVSFYKSVKEEFFFRYSLIMDALIEYTKEELAILEEILTEGVNQGIFEIYDVRLTARAMIKAIEGFDFFIFQGEEFNKIQSELSEALKIFIKGISTGS